MLTIIFEARKNQSKIKNVEINHFIERVYNASLNILLERWRAESRPIDNRFLRLFYQMALLSEGYLPSPPLQMTWDGLIARLNEMLSAAKINETLNDISAFEDSIEFVEIVIDQEPRFLQYINFPNCIRNQINTFLGICIEDTKGFIQFEAEESSLYDLYDGERQRYESIAEAVEKYLDLNLTLELEYKGEDIVSALRDAAESYKSEAEKYYIAEPDYEEEGGKGHSENINIRELFSDL